MEQLTLRELKTATGGQLLGECRDETVLIGGAESDNRKIRGGDVFFAFPGTRTDGHDYVPAALAAGAAGCVISRELPEYLPGKFYLLVRDTVAALGDLAKYYRGRFRIPVTGVTGSVGKTTTKDMIAAVFSEKLRTLSTEGNYNNNIGLPKTVLRLDGSVQAAVLEMGMNHFGELSYLTAIARPDTAVITNIGDAHIGNLGSKEGILKAKCEIFEGVPDGGCAVLNADDPYLETLRGDEEPLRRLTVIRVGEAQDADLRAADIDDTMPDRMRFTLLTSGGESIPVAVPAPGRHMIYPALTAAAVGLRHGLSLAEIAKGISSYVPTGLRMKIEELPGGSILLNDAYNANPQSMKAGLTVLSRQEGKRRIAVIGDMLELGDSEERLHREVGAFAAQLPIDVLIAVGSASAAAADEAKAQGMPDVRVCADKEEAKRVLETFSVGNTAYLVKASRSMQLEEISGFIRDRYA